MRQPHLRKLLVTLALATLLVAAACGSEPSPSDIATQTAEADQPRYTVPEVILLIRAEARQNRELGLTGTSALSCSSAPIYQGQGIWYCGNWVFDETTGESFTRK